MSSDDFDDDLKSINTPDNETSFTIYGLTPGTNYVVCLSAYTGAGEGDKSFSISVLTPITG